jgi:glycosyltransferase involved in cell wall biosynthesis
VKQVVLFFPFESNKSLESGISARLNGVGSWFKKRGWRPSTVSQLSRVNLADVELVYTLVSTKPESTSAQLLELLPKKSQLVVDLYTPVLLEKELTLSKWKPHDLTRRLWNQHMVKKFLQRGSHFLVANRRQQRYWREVAMELGVLLRKKDISVLPTGAPKLSAISYQPSAARRNVMLWFGGIYPWMDPAPLINLFSLLAPKHPDRKLRFLGGFHPGTGYQGKYQKVVKDAKEKISEEQLEFVPWQPKNKLREYLEDVAAAVHLAKRTREDYLAHRVRLLTLLNSGIPILTNGRDVISELLIANGAGLKFPAELFPSFRKLRQMSRRALRIERSFLKQELDVNSLESLL